MTSRAFRTTLIGIASCIASFLAGIAYADGFGRSPGHGVDAAGAIEVVVPVLESCDVEAAAAAPKPAGFAL